MDRENRKIMICDDDQGILDVLEMLLEPEGFEVSKEIDSTLLLEKVKAERPDLLLLDLWMPVLSGYDLIKKIRSDREVKNLPIIVLSASRNEKDIALETGANHFMAKPFDIEEIILLVNESLGN
ncbi:response regulator [Chryseobacterium foetidum]|uniref:response regulator n=1 Tax=Chryseobacterium foetidum TaxID=2951057 RepID=UPI0021C6AC72|nr:response regulator [Chryseobacterium foetidum]